MLELEQYPTLGKVVTGTLEIWPEHVGYISRSLAGRPATELRLLDEVSADIIALCGPGFRAHAESYRWLSGVFLEEELEFRRSGQYRCKTIAEAIENVYGNTQFMRRYMEGLLVSQVFWANHASAYIEFCTRFLPSLASLSDHGFDYLEVGPGHGLYFARVLRHSSCRQASCIDVSRESLRQTATFLSSLGNTRTYNMIETDIQTVSPAGSYDAICISEVLEHLEQPLKALSHVAQALKPDGRIYVNVPINSPAPDHIYLYRTPDEVAKLVSEAGLKIEHMSCFPMTGQTLDRAMRHALTVNCGVIATKSGSKAS